MTDLISQITSKFTAVNTLVNGTEQLVALLGPDAMTIIKDKNTWDKIEATGDVLMKVGKARTIFIGMESAINTLKA